jgi:hypothetical protein
MDAAFIPQWAEWLENTSLGLIARESMWGFQILVATHIMAIAFSAGLVFWFDLRLLGVTLQRWPVAAFYRRLAPWMLTGFAVMFGSGAWLFTGFATKAYPNIYFRLKMSAILLGAINALVFHFLTERHLAGWNEGTTPPSARLAGAISISVWAIAILAGRMMAYTMY